MDDFLGYPYDLLETSPSGPWKREFGDLSRFRTFRHLWIIAAAQWSWMIWFNTIHSSIEVVDIAFLCVSNIQYPPYDTPKWIDASLCHYSFVCKIILEGWDDWWRCAWIWWREWLMELLVILSGFRLTHMTRPQISQIMGIRMLKRGINN